MTLPMFEYENQLADLQNQYARTKQAQEYGRFVGQQRFSRDREDMNRGFTQGFPKITGGLAQRFGSRYGGGAIGGTVKNAVNGFQRQMGALDADEASWTADQNAQATLGDTQYQAALQRLMEQLNFARGQQDPFAVYKGVYQ